MAGHPPLRRVPATPGLLRGPGSDAAGLRVLVAGLGTSGTAAAAALLRAGAAVLAADAGTDVSGRARDIEAAGARLVLGAAAGDPAVLGDAALVVASPGWHPTHPVLTAAAAAGVPVWSEAELAWRLRDPAGPPWLCVTGTNGKTTTVGLLAGLLASAGLPALAAGNIGLPLTDAILDTDARVLAVELSSFQLHHTHTVAPLAAACLNVAADHLDWHGDYDAYRRDKAKVYARTSGVCVYTVADPQTEAMVAAAEVAPGCRAVGVSLGPPRPGMLGVVDDVLVDRAFGPDPDTTAREIATLADVAAFSGRIGNDTAGGDVGGEVVAPGPPAPHTVSNVLTAAALALSAGAPVQSLAGALRVQHAPGHRGDVVARWRGVRFVDDSKATNPHAAEAALRGATATAAGGATVWIAGGQAKGASFDDLAASHGAALRAAVLVGTDREVVAAALIRHAPHVHRLRVDPADTGDVDEFMDRVVAAAVAVARPGDTVLLAPGAASLDQFTGYAARGDAFVRAVARVVARRTGSAA